MFKAVNGITFQHNVFNSVAPLLFFIFIFSVQYRMSPYLKCSRSSASQVKESCTFTQYKLPASREITEKIYTKKQ